MPGSAGHGFHMNGIGSGLPKYGWDPSIVVAPDHTVYVAYMLYRGTHVYPVIATSHDHGATFSHLSRLVPPRQNNWGDRDFIAVSHSGTLYLTWDYGRSLKTRYGNIVIQRSRDGGKTWSRIAVVTPGFPSHGGGVAAPLLVGPGGRLDVGIWVWRGGGVRPYALPPNHVYFTSSDNGGKTWSKPVAIQPGVGWIDYFVTWIDIDLSIDSAGNLYATWDTPASRMAGNSPQGFAQYLRPFSILTGWLAGPIRVSRQFGNFHVWPGDTIGLSLLPSSGHRQRKIQVSWGSAVTAAHVSQIFTATVSP